MVLSMTTHPRYQYQPAEPFQMDSSGHRIRLGSCLTDKTRSSNEAVLVRFRFG